MTTTVTIASTDSGNQTVSEAMFGVINTGYHNFGEFQDQFDFIGGSDLRWPGGTLAEKRGEVYGLDVEGLFDATDLYAHNPGRVRADFDGMILFANDTNSDLSVIVPTARYENDLVLGADHFTSFLTDLANGTYAALDTTLTLEIGNEYAGTVDGGAQAYGEIAETLLDAYSSFLDVNPSFLLDWNIEITLQLGYNETDNSHIMNAVSDENLAFIDDLIVHNLPLRFEAIDKPQTGAQFSLNDTVDPKWQNALDYAGDWQSRFDALGLVGPDLNLSAWTIGSSENDPQNVDLAYQDYGLRQASAALELFSTYVAAGVDSASLWGVGVNNLNSFATFTDGEVDLSPGGVMFKWMSESIAGKTLHDGFVNNSRDDPFMTYVYEDADQMVIFVAANDIDAASASLRLDLLGYGEFLAVRVDSLTSTTGSFDAQDPSLRLDEEAVVSGREWLGAIGNVDLNFQMDFEVKRVILAKTDIGAQDLIDMQTDQNPERMIAFNPITQPTYAEPDLCNYVADLHLESFLDHDFLF